MEVNAQHKIVLESTIDNWKTIASVNVRLRDRATTVLASSAALMSFVAAGELTNTGSLLRSGFVCTSLLLGGLVTFVCMWAFRPTKMDVPGAEDATVIRDAYLDVDAEEMMLQMISDTADCISKAKTSNMSITYVVRWMLLIFMAQVISVACAVASVFF